MSDRSGMELSGEDGDHPVATAAIYLISAGILLTLVALIVVPITLFVFGPDAVTTNGQAGVNIDVDDAADEIHIEVTALGSADYVNVTGDVRNESVDSSAGIYYEDDRSATGWSEPGPEQSPNETLSNLTVGDYATIGSADNQTADVLMGDRATHNGTIKAVAVLEEDNITTQVASETYDLEWENN